MVHSVGCGGVVAAADDADAGVVDGVEPRAGFRGVVEVTGTGEPGGRQPQRAHAAGGHVRHGRLGVQGGVVEHVDPGAQATQRAQRVDAGPGAPRRGRGAPHGVSEPAAGAFGRDAHVVAGRSRRRPGRQRPAQGRPAAPTVTADVPLEPQRRVAAPLRRAAMSNSPWPGAAIAGWDVRPLPRDRHDDQPLPCAYQRCCNVLSVPRATTSMRPGAHDTAAGWDANAPPRSSWRVHEPPAG